MSEQTTRVPAIDVIRGMALLGILLINIQTYALFLFLRPEQVYALQLDQPASYEPLQFALHLLVKGQFYTIYSFLFGLGFYLMMEKNRKLGLDGDKLFKRRLWLLLAIGLVHGLVFWFGDILHKYALLGFTLLYFNRKTVAVLWKWIAGLALAGLLIQLVKLFLSTATPESLAASQAQTDVVIMQVLKTWQTGGVLEVMGMQKLGVAMLHVMSIQNGMASWLQYEMMFLLGLIAGKTRVFHRLAELKGQLLNMACWLLLPALLLKAFSSLPVLQWHPLPNAFALERALFAIAEFAATPLLSVCYLIGLGMLCQASASPVLRWIGNAGRMGLTNYLAQTLICMLLFYHYGLGLSGRLNLAGALMVAVCIYIVQLAGSNFWLARHESGPAEKWWRRLTYR